MAENETQKRATREVDALGQNPLAAVENMHQTEVVKEKVFNIVKSEANQNELITTIIVTILSKHVAPIIVNTLLLSIPPLSMIGVNKEMLDGMINKLLNVVVGTGVKHRKEIIHEVKEKVKELNVEEKMQFIAHTIEPVIIDKKEQIVKFIKSKRRAATATRQILSLSLSPQPLSLKRAASR